MHNNNNKITLSSSCTRASGLGRGIQVDASLKLDHTNAQQALAILCDPEAHMIFRNVERILHRRPLPAPPQHEQSIVSQVGRWRLGFLTGTFGLCVQVVVDRNACTMAIKQVRLPRELEALEERALEQLANSGEDARRTGAFSGFEGCWTCVPTSSHIDGESSSSACEVHLTHCVRLAFVPPFPLDRLVRRVAEGVIRDMFRDLAAEADRRSGGSTAPVRASSSRRGGGRRRVALLDDFFDAERRRRRRLAAGVLALGMGVKYLLTTFGKHKQA